MLCHAQSTVAQSYIDNYDVNRHDRFVADRMNTQFIAASPFGFELDFSGVGRGESGAGRWVTMISPTHFLTSNHGIADEGEVVLYAGNELDSPTITCTIDPDVGRRVGETDVWLGAISSESCDTSAITYYPIAEPGDYIDQDVYMVGKSDRRPGARSTDVRIGRNRVSYLHTDSFFRGTGDHAVYVIDAEGGDLVNEPQQANPDREPDELVFANGDSGGPTFIVNSRGELELFGIHSYLGYDGTPGEDGFDADRWANVDTYLPTERNLIYAEIQFDDPSFEFQPERSRPVGAAQGRSLYVVEDTRDCSLNGVVDAADLECTTWVGSLTSLDFVLEELDVPIGDLNLDGEVGFYDFLTLTNNFSTEGSYRDGDLDLDGQIQFSDFLVLSGAFGAASPSASSSAAAATVPEPASGRAYFMALVLIFIAVRTRNSR